MKKRSLTLFILICACYISYGQWEERPIVIDGLDATVRFWLDINNDGLEDFVGYDEDKNSFFYRENTGQGLLEAAPFMSNTFIQENNITRGDWDKDGDIDLLAQLSQPSSSEIALILLLNNSDGSFSSSEFTIDSNQFFGDLDKFGDFNNDGLSDILIKHVESRFVYINENGEYKQVGEALNSSFFSAATFTVEDMDGDGFDDLIETDRQIQMNIFEWVDGEMKMTQTIGAEIFTDNTNGAYNTGLRIKDIDFDGDLDIVRGISRDVATNVGDIIEIQSLGANYYYYIQDENGDFSERWFFYSAPEESFSYTLVQDEENQSTKLITQYDQFYEYTFSNNEFVLSNNYQLQEFEYSTYYYTNSFLNGRHVLYPNKETLMLGDSYFADGPSTEQTDAYHWTECYGCPNVILNDYTDIDIADTDGDNDLDILVSSTSNSHQLVLIENHKSGCHFENMHPILLEIPGYDPTSVTAAMADFDNDGDTDVAVKLDIEPASIFILRNDGTGSFSQPEFLMEIEDGRDIYAEDLYNDGYAEIILRVGARGTFFDQFPETFATHILNNTSGIENSAIEIFDNLELFGKLQFPDLNNDGLKDLLVNNFTPYNVSGFRYGLQIYNNSGNTMILTQVDTSFSDIAFVDAFDYDMDGFPDLVGSETDLTSMEAKLSLYNNIQGNFDFSNPSTLLEFPKRSEFLGIHNEDSSIGFVAFDGLNAKGVLSYYSQGEKIDTLDFINPQNYLVADFNNDGFDDILASNVDGALNFFTRGIIDCSEVTDVPEYEDFEWLAQQINDADGCCEINKIESYFDGDLRYVYTIPRDDCPQHSEQLYSSEGELICTEPIEFVGECISNFNLDNFEKELIWQCGDAVSNSNTFHKNEVEVYPNPSKGVFNIDRNTQGILKVYNSQGICILSYDHIPSSINFENLMDGIYLFSFSYKDAFITKRLIKM